MKTTIDLPDAVFRQARAIAAARGVTLRRFFTEALEEELRRCADGNQVGNGRPSLDGRLRRAIRSRGRTSSRPRRDRGGVREARSRRPRVILDTNALSAWAEGRAAVEAPLRSAERLVVPSVVLGEYYFGIRQSRHRNRYEEWLARYPPLTEVAAVTSATTEARPPSAAPPIRALRREISIVSSSRAGVAARPVGSASPERERRPGCRAEPTMPRRYEASGRAGP